jgi:hypothetical protein
VARKSHEKPPHLDGRLALGLKPGLLLKRGKSRFVALLGMADHERKSGGRGSITTRRSPD